MSFIIWLLEDASHLFPVSEKKQSIPLQTISSSALPLMWLVVEDRLSKTARLNSAEGMEALQNAHPVLSQLDLLVVHVFPKLDWESRIAVERTCKKWRLWWRLRQLTYDVNFMGPRATVNEWILNDVIYNDGRDFHAWINKDMTVYFDGFPFLFGKEE